MKLAEAFAKKAYRDRSKVESTYCVGQARATYYITIKPHIFDTFDGDDYVDHLIDPLDTWLGSLNEKNEVNDWDMGKPLIIVSVVGTTSLQDVMNQIDSFAAQIA